MALDKTLEFSDKQALTADAISTVVHENTRASKDAWGNSISNQIGGMSFNVAVTTTMTGSGSATITLRTKADASLSSGATTIATIVLAAATVAGTRKSVILPAGTERLAFLGAYIDESASSAVTAGNANIWLGLKQEKID